MITDLEIAWLAGFYEGEGCLCPLRRRRDDRLVVVSWTLSITSADEDVLRRAHALAGVGRVGISKQPGPHTYWRWNVCARADLAWLVPLLVPYLGARRMIRAREFLAWHEDRPAIRAVA